MVLGLFSLKGRTMNESQRKQIWKLRVQGLGYGVIGKSIGLSKDSVKKYCRRHPELRGCGILPQLMVKERLQDGTHCSQCFQPMVIKTTGRPKRFCSSKCRAHWWRSHQNPGDKSTTRYHELTCKECGRSFLTYANPKRKYCSHTCYIKARFYTGE